MADQARPLALMTGAAADGIGQAVLHRLVADGYDVIGSYDPADDDAARALQRTMSGVTLVQVDHADRPALERLVKTVPPDREISAVVNAHFYFAMENPDDFDYALWDRSLAENLTAPLFLFHQLSGRLAERASVVTVTSTEAFVGSFGASAYAASKAAVHNLTMTLANLSGNRSIRVNAVAAGWIGGVMDTDEVFNMSRRITPLGRLGAPDEIAAVVAFLLSESAAFVNGTVITTDGGYRGVDTIAKHEFDAARSDESDLAA